MRLKERGRRSSDDKLLSRRQAVQHLGVPKGTLKTLIDQGMLEPVKSAGKTWFYLSDLNNAAKVITRKLDVATANANALRALAQGVRLERMMKMLMFMLGAKKEFEPLTPERVYADWKKAMDNVHRRFEDLTSSELIEWARLLFGVDEAFLILAGDMMNHAEPWLPFMKVSETILGHKPDANDKEMKAAFEYFLIAHRSMRMAAYFYCRRSYGARKANRNFPDSQDANLVSSLLAIIEHAEEPTDGSTII